ncbi:helicase-related protein [Zeaxanthinibacter enoshimensis]|uniref:SNF2 domain-containing protein n=1 Tax=Zeaxanthinibacter enoshimensis TaxID=392009 RepID=A0A4R6TS24_9FLAO|nr:helicase-related protein [Zeaxanthinibacter enoshimensis]TDQ33376.1 SNF2 domain-containing protein [Zeaxanthinibacter enoshimensis]
MIKEHKPGTLVNYRGRDWIVMPSDDNEVLNIKPLGGSDHEITGVFLPLSIPGQEITDTEIDYPRVNDLGDFHSAKMLFHASRLSFRNAAGPFRCMGKLSFRPRSYQVIPLVMSLKQEVTRLLIADDVGIGKTVEALMILKEAMERGEVERFAVICLPHLCEQWKSELKDKLDLEAEIIRSSTIAGLERKIPDDQSVFHHYPYQVISIDYVKQSSKKGIFLTDCPEFIIVDEAHTCTMPAGAKSKNQQLRHSLLHDIAIHDKRHLLLLTATPHSGKDEEFRSLLSLLNKKFGQLDFENITPQQRKELARYFVQRKRANITRWLNQDTPFPERETKEIGYSLSSDYQDFYNEILDFAQGITQHSEGQKGRTHYWAALALLRGVMSTPQAGLEMLKARREKRLVIERDQEENPLLVSEENDTDVTETALMEQLDFDAQQISRIDRLIQALENLTTLKRDKKAQIAVKQVEEWVKAGVYPIVFCRYIASAQYLGTHFKDVLPRDVDVQVITSEFADEQRKEMVDAMGKSERRVLVATDCLSEGINLQEHFTAVLHYDLPWNPNRLEQREGRVDRYGQVADKVYAYLLWGEDNPIDKVVLNVLIKKVRDIQKATGVSIVIGDENNSIMDSVLKEVLLEPKKVAAQKTLDFGDEFSSANTIITNQLEQAKEKAEKLRSIFAHESIDPKTIEKELKEVDEVIGDDRTVESFVIQAAQALGGIITQDLHGFNLDTTNLPEHLKRTLPDLPILPLSFVSPTPRGRVYIGRNHKFVEQLAQLMMSQALEPKAGHSTVARSAVIQTDAVNKRTTIVQFRVRNVIKEVGRKRELIAEEMYLWGFTGTIESREILDYKQCKDLLLRARSLVNIPYPRQTSIFEEVEDTYSGLSQEVQKLAEARANHLVESHGRFKELVGGRRFEAVHPVLPPDIMGIYVLMPKPKAL